MQPEFRRQARLPESGSVPFFLSIILYRPRLCAPARHNLT